METRRAQTLEALEAFIQAQRTLLTRTQSDIERLQILKSDALTQPSTFVSNLSSELGASAFRLSDQSDSRLALPQNIDWTVYDAHDPSALQTLALKSQHRHSQRNQPHSTQRSELSDLQKLVKEARRTIVDPVLAKYDDLSDPGDASEEHSEIDLIEARREKEREKLRDLRKRKIQTCGLKLPSFRARGPSGVFVRKDVEDESIEVDISQDDASGQDINVNSMFLGVDASSTSKMVPAALLPAPSSSVRSSRARRPSNKLQAHNENKKIIAAAQPRRKSKAAKPMDKGEGALEIPPPPSVVKQPKNTSKPKPETYKQAWSMSEQHLLEQLLEQIPEGEKNRWQKISRAMNGKRTPRQVASRVQKYFEKLKRFGIGERG